MGRNQTFEALIVDYGGVLTEPVRPGMDRFLNDEGIDREAFRGVLRDWLGTHGRNPIQDLQTGRMSVPAFEQAFAHALSARMGKPVVPEGLLSRLFAGGAASDESMYSVVRRARLRGIKTAVLSNSWSLDYPRQRWEGLFDAVVISGEVGMRKPEAPIYRFTASTLGVAPEACVFVDDLRMNVLGAAGVGMAGIWHRDLSSTNSELAALFGW